jgi:hypothetical protein
MHAVVVIALLGVVGFQVGGPCAAAHARETAPEPRTLQAIFLDVEGKVRWRADEQSAWREAKVNDLVGEGAEVRTGLRSRATLRVGRNASILIDAGTSFELPQLEQDGQTLRTLASVKTGRVDFKVDKVGYANDFKVATPQTTLSVRGTGFAVNTGSLNGVEVVGARTNMINAIELKYVMSNLRYFMSGASTSSSRNQDPVKSAWLSTLGPPQVAGTIADPSQLEQAAAQGQAGNAPTNPQQFQQISAAEGQQLPRPEGSVIGGLLKLQEGEFSTLETRTNDIIRETKFPVEEGSTRDQIEQVRAAAVSRQAGIAGTLSARASMGERNDALETLKLDSDASNLEMLDLRAAMDTAIAEDDDDTVADKLDRMGEIDDDWQGELKAQSLELVARLESLQTDLETAAAAAQASDESFNALLPGAQDGLSVVTATADSLSAFQTAIERYRDAVVVAFRSGEVGEDAMKKLLRSVEILQQSSQRISLALASLQAATARLSDAQSIVSQGDALALALTALAEGGDIANRVPGLQAHIDANIDAIESARFGAFFAAAAASVSAIEESSASAQAERDAAVLARDSADTASSQAELQIQETERLAAAMQAFWTTPGEGQGFSPKARMEALLTQSETDRDAMAQLLTELTGSIDTNNEAGATLFLGDMQALDNLWRDPETGLLVEVNSIDSNMQGQLAGVQAEHDAASISSRNFEELLEQADARRDQSELAAARMKVLRTRIEQYLTQHQALVAQGRGPEGAAASLEAAASALQGVLGAYAAGIEASEQAAAAAEDARTYGQRVLFSAAANARAASANLAIESSGLRDQIVSNIDQLHQDLVTGQTRFNDAFGGQGGGDQGGGDQGGGGQGGGG